MASDSLISALEQFPRGQRATIAHVLRAAALRAPCLSSGQLLTAWSVFAANDLGGLKAIRSFPGFRRKNREAAKEATKTLCEQGLLQHEADVIIVPLKGSTVGGPYCAPSTPVYTWRPPEKNVVSNELDPISYDSDLYVPPVETRTWRPTGFIDRFLFPEPLMCPRLDVYLATAKTIKLVEQGNENGPSPEILKRWTMEVPVRDLYMWKDNAMDPRNRYPFPQEFADFFMDPQLACWTHDYYVSDIYVQLLQRAPEVASRYYRLDLAPRSQRQTHLNLPDAAVLTVDGHVDHFKMFGGGSFRALDETRWDSDFEWSRTTLCQIHERIQNHSYEFY